MSSELLVGIIIVWQFNALQWSLFTFSLGSLPVISGQVFGLGPGCQLVPRTLLNRASTMGVCPPQGFGEPQPQLVIPPEGSPHQGPDGHPAWDWWCSSEHQPGHHHTPPTVP